MNPEQAGKIFDDNADEISGVQKVCMSKEKFIEVVLHIDMCQANGCKDCIHENKVQNNTCATCEGYSNYITKF